MEVGYKMHHINVEGGGKGLAGLVSSPDPFSLAEGVGSWDETKLARLY